MPRKQSEDLTTLGHLISEMGLNLTFITEKTGISRHRLINLRTNPKAGFLFDEARVLAPVFRMSLDELGGKLDEIKNSGDAK